MKCRASAKKLLLSTALLACIGLYTNACLGLSPEEEMRLELDKEHAAREKQALQQAAKAKAEQEAKAKQAAQDALAEKKRQAAEAAKAQANEEHRRELAAAKAKADEKAAEEAAEKERKRQEEAKTKREQKAATRKEKQHNIAETKMLDSNLAPDRVKWKIIISLDSSHKCNSRVHAALRSACAKNTV